MWSAWPSNTICMISSWEVSPSLLWHQQSSSHLRHYVCMCSQEHHHTTTAMLDRFYISQMVQCCWELLTISWLLFDELRHTPCSIDQIVKVKLGATKHVKLAFQELGWFCVYTMFWSATPLMPMLHSGKVRQKIWHWSGFTLKIGVDLIAFLSNFSMLVIEHIAPQISTS